MFQYRHSALILEQKADRWHNSHLLSKILHVWWDFAESEKIAMRQKERLSREHNVMYVYLVGVSFVRVSIFAIFGLVPHFGPLSHFCPQNEGKLPLFDPICVTVPKCVTCQICGTGQNVAIRILCQLGVSYLQAYEEGGFPRLEEFPSNVETGKGTGTPKGGTPEKGCLHVT